MFQGIRLFLLFAICLLTSDICVPASARANDEDVLANADSVEVPAKSHHVMLDAAFISPGGHLVLQADGLDDGGLRVNFYDAQTGDWLLPAPLTSKDDVIAEQNRLTAGGYTRLEHMPMITLTNGATVFNFIDTKNVCFRPYAIFLVIAPPGGDPVESAVYLKSQSPRMIYSAKDPAHANQPLTVSHDCASAAGGHPVLTAHYEQQSPFFFSDGAGGFFMLVSRYAIHFDSSGNSAFFKGQDNPIYLAPDDAHALRGILAKADKNKNPQDAIDQADALIENVMQKQTQEVQ